MSQIVTNNPTSDPSKHWHLLSFDVEEYFQVEAASAAGVTRDQWDSWPGRLSASVDKLLELLDSRSTFATFFVLGWVAQKQPEVVKRIAAAGHEIASHGMTHQMLTRMDPSAFRDELITSRKLLEDIASKPVIGYRAPTFSVMKSTAWAFDVLIEAGYLYDSSVFPVRHDRYGVPDAPRHTHWAVAPGGERILEIPPATLRAFGLNMPVGGGGYMRLLPTWVPARGLRSFQNSGHHAMIYLHPWELDPDQPPLPLSRLGRWRHTVNLHKTHAKLSRLMRMFRFRAVADVFEEMKISAEGEFQYAEA